MIRSRFAVTLFSLFTGLSLAGCGHVSPQGHPLQNTVIDKDGMAVQLKVSENPIVARKKTEFTVHVSPETSSSPQLQVQKVWIQESMPNMSMPKSITPMKSSQSETYTGQSILPMGGPWVLQVYVKLPNKTVSVSFPVHVQE